MKRNRPVDEGGQKDLLVGLKVLPAGPAAHPGGLADLLVLLVLLVVLLVLLVVLLVLLVVLLVLPVDLAGHLGAEDDGQRKA